MLKIKDLPESAMFYGYAQNGKIIVIPPQLNRYYKYSRRLVQSLADLQKRDMYLYSINFQGEIYFVRKITCVQNRNKKGGKQ